MKKLLFFLSILIYSISAFAQITEDQYKQSLITRLGLNNDWRVNVEEAYFPTCRALGEMTVDIPANKSRSQIIIESTNEYGYLLRWSGWVEGTICFKGEKKSFVAKLRKCDRTQLGGEALKRWCPWYR